MDVKTVCFHKGTAAEKCITFRRDSRKLGGTMAKSKKHRRTLAGSALSGLAGRAMKCTVLSRSGPNKKTVKLRCTAFVPGPGFMSRAARKAAGVKVSMPWTKARRKAAAKKGAHTRKQNLIRRAA